MASDPPKSNENESRQQRSAQSVAQQHGSNLLHTLEISPYELAFLEQHLLNNDFVPESLTDKAIDEARPRSLRDVNKNRPAVSDFCSLSMLSIHD
jgi:hypothetical protein